MRLPFVVLGTWAALKQDALSTISFGCAAVATDVGDGIFARRWDLTSEWGSNLDSAMDFVFYSALAYWTYLFAPEGLGQHASLIATYFSFYVTAHVASWFLRHTIAVHGRLSRTTALVGSLIALYFIAVGYDERLLFVAFLMGTADLGHRLHSIVQAVATKQGAST